MTLVVGTNTYITAANAEIYLGDSIRYATWSALSEAYKEQALISAARMLSRQKWQGTPNVEGQALSFPRSGLVDREGVTIPEEEVPTDVINAQCELAIALVAKASIETTTDSSSNLKTAKAGSTSIEYFRPIPGTRFPTIVNELIGYLLSGYSCLAIPTVTGTEAESHFVGNNFESGTVR